MKGINEVGLVTYELILIVSAVNNNTGVVYWMLSNLAITILYIMGSYIQFVRKFSRKTSIFTPW